MFMERVTLTWKVYHRISGIGLAGDQPILPSVHHAAPNIRMSGCADSGSANINTFNACATGTCYVATESGRSDANL